MHEGIHQLHRGQFAAVKRNETFEPQFLRHFTQIRSYEIESEPVVIDISNATHLRLQTLDQLHILAEIIPYIISGYPKIAERFDRTANIPDGFNLSGIQMNIVDIARLHESQHHRNTPPGLRTSDGICHPTFIADDHDQIGRILVSLQQLLHPHYPGIDTGQGLAIHVFDRNPTIDPGIHFPKKGVDDDSAVLLVGQIGTDYQNMFRGFVLCENTRRQYHHRTDQKKKEKKIEGKLVVNLFIHQMNGY